MDVLDTSIMGMLFRNVSFQTMLHGNPEELKQEQTHIAECLGNMIAALGGVSPAFQQSVAQTTDEQYSQILRILFKTSVFVAQHHQKPKHIWEVLSRLGSGAVLVGNASQIAATTTSAIVTFCHIVASYDNAMQLADANAKLDELLKVHGREYKAELESVYNRVGELFLEAASGHVVVESLKNCSQALDRLTVIWLDEIRAQLEPVGTSTAGLDHYRRAKRGSKVLGGLTLLPPLIPLTVVMLLVTGPMTLTGHIVYSQWVNNIRERLDKVSSLIRLMSVSIWLRHVICHHTGTQQPLQQYTDRLQNIATTAKSIKDAVIKSAKLINADVQVTQQLERVEQLPQHIKAMLTDNWVVPQFSSNSQGAIYRVAFDQDSQSFVVDGMSTEHSYTFVDEFSPRD